MIDQDDIKHDGKKSVSYIYGTSWSTQVTLKLVWDEQSTLSPGLSFVHPFSSTESRAFGVGGGISGHATRTETVTFGFNNADLISAQKSWLTTPGGQGKSLRDCAARETGAMINSNLKIKDFIVDKSTIARLGIASTNDISTPAFSVFQEDITFVGTYNANFTPSWKLVKFTANPTGNLVSGTRTVTGDVLITLGSAASDGSNQLGANASSQHNAAVGAGATATQIGTQTQH